MRIQPGTSWTVPSPATWVDARGRDGTTPFTVSLPQRTLQGVLRATARVRRIWFEVLLVGPIVLGLAVLGSVQHVAYKWVAMRLALRDFSYPDTENVRAYFVRVGQQVMAGRRSDRERVEALIAWLRRHMPISPGAPLSPNPVYMIRAGGICGQFAAVLKGMLEANGFEARHVLLNWAGTYTPHVVIEARVGARWVAFDALGFAAAGETFTPSIWVNGVGQSILDLYRRPWLLPNNTYGRPFFAAGRSFKVEVLTDYRQFVVAPKAVYGRDWPLVRLDRPETVGWGYGDARSRAWQVVVWGIAPYFARVVVWTGPTPIILHFEWMIIAIGLGAYGLVRTGWRGPGGHVWWAWAGLAVVSLAYLVVVTLLWYHRFVIAG